MLHRLPLLPDRFCRRLDVWAVVGTAGGILWTGCGCSPLLRLIFSAVAAGFVFILMPWRRGAALLLFFLLGAVLTCWQRRIPADSCEAVLMARDTGAAVQVRITDPGLTDLPFLPPPGMIRAELRRVQLTGEPAARPVSGDVYLQFSRDAGCRVRYGDILNAEGIFLLPRDDGIMLSVNGGPPEWQPSGTGGFRHYLRSRRVAAMFRVAAGDIAGYEPGIMGRLLAWRDIMARRLTGGLEPVAVRREAAALFFGCRSGIDRAAQVSSIRSGTIHLYSVSGLHVGIWGCLLLWCCRGLPYRWRYLVPPLPLLAYVLTTGANPPALRAWGMLTVWSLLRASLLWMPGTAVLAWTAAVLLWLNPASIADAGFLYSFTITGMLLLLGEQRDGSGGRYDPLPLMPVSPLRDRMARRICWRNRLIAVPAAVLTAFLGGLLISGTIRGEFFWASIPANLLLVPLVFWLFPLAAAKILVGFGWLDTLLAAVLSGMWRVMDGVVTVTAGWDSGWGCNPQWWQVMLFYSGLAVLLLPRAGWRFRLGGAGMALLVLGSIGVAGLTAGPAIFFSVGGGSEMPLFAVADTRARLGCVVNAPHRGSVAAAVAFLQQRGIVQVAEFQVSAPRLGSIRALRTLTARMPVMPMVLPPHDRYDHRFRAELAELAGEGAAIVFAPAGGLVTVERDSFHYRNPASGVTASAVRRDGCWEIKFMEKCFRIKSVGSSIPECYIYE